MNILVTGGLGYIGSHTVLELLAKNYRLIILDNLSNSQKIVGDWLQSISGKKIPIFYDSAHDASRVREIFQDYKIDGIIHFAAFKAVGESVENPGKYYHNNLESLRVILEAARYHKPFVVFSSSATVYKPSNSPPFLEDMELGAINPYGWTKILGEQILQDYARAYGIRTVCLRYFNPVGAHISGKLGELPQSEAPPNLFPFILSVAHKKQDCLRVFGGDYPTPDGTPQRDYIHVQDLAQVHVRALELQDQPQHFHDNFLALNVGTGKPTSVLEIIQSFQSTNQVEIPYKIVERRAGDMAVSYASTKKLESILDWQPQFSLEDMCRHGFGWSKRYFETN